LRNVMRTTVQGLAERSDRPIGIDALPRFEYSAGRFLAFVTARDNTFLL